ncbi:DUF4893 domain-containing protein [Sphingomonas carotinifaciens]|uniref:DUF4893 domain-containing protein n=2 Tax=Sphingomonas carotinifaciens TaxID=1166323 RepID=A0A6N8LTP6_9SPHN|nr:DUF4893 domain-containing protein [Sphingomonas carotinifaciens]MBB4085188.1 hypothetical protein [Sphingomonas carotinifaciens]MWC43784.1 DUF4893 domain-containing protein [Sphingomonas carotinifaciens]
MMRWIGMGLCGALAACGGGRHAPVRPAVTPVVTSQEEPAWRSTISPGDALRLEGLPARWAAAQAGLERRGRATVASEGDLLRGDAALDHAALPPGSYKCRLLVMSGRVVRSFPAFFCYVGSEDGERLSFTKQTGSALPGGWLYPDGTKRYVFMGARQKQAGDGSLGYGEDPERDLFGVVERIGPFRWRLVLPGEDLQVYELTPVPVEQQAK